MVGGEDKAMTSRPRVPEGGGVKGSVYSSIPLGSDREASIDKTATCGHVGILVGVTAVVSVVLGPRLKDSSEYNGKFVWSFVSAVTGKVDIISSPVSPGWRLCPKS